MGNNYDNPLVLGIISAKLNFICIKKILRKLYGSLIKSVKSDFLIFNGIVGCFNIQIWK